MNLFKQQTWIVNVCFSCVLFIFMFTPVINLTDYALIYLVLYKLHNVFNKIKSICLYSPILHVLSPPHCDMNQHQKRHLPLYTYFVII